MAHDYLIQTARALGAGKGGTMYNFGTASHWNVNVLATVRPGTLAIYPAFQHFQRESGIANALLTLPPWHRHSLKRSAI